jgi:hypothetical protein
MSAFVTKPSLAEAADYCSRPGRAAVGEPIGATLTGRQEVVWLVGSSSRGKAPVEAPGPLPGTTGIVVGPTAPFVPLAGAVPLLGAVKGEIAGAVPDMAGTEPDTAGGDRGLNDGGANVCGAVPDCTPACGTGGRGISGIGLRAGVGVRAGGCVGCSWPFGAGAA